MSTLVQVNKQIPHYLYERTVHGFGENKDNTAVMETNSQGNELGMS
jgi:hypothetical protein